MAIRTFASAMTLTVVLAASAAAQIGGKPIVGGNPTPGTPQPDPPNLADRVTVTGCLQLSSRSAATTSGAVDGNAVIDSRFALADAERQTNLPAETGGSPLTATETSRTYRLAAIESQLSPFVGTKVEISGEILPRAAASPPGAPPTVQVEFVQRLGASCRTSG